MGKIPHELREIIARNVRNCRLQKFPGRGGGKKCAEAFGVSPQQWSPWEKGKRTPDEVRLAQIAGFFGVTVEWMRCDNRPASARQPLEPSLSGLVIGSLPPGVGQSSPDTGDMGLPFGGILGVDAPPLPAWEPVPPGSAASFYWLARHLVAVLQTQGLLVHLDKQSLEHLAHFIKSL